MCIHHVSCTYACECVRCIHVHAQSGFHLGRGGVLPLEFENIKLLDMSSTSVKPQETLVVSLGKHNDITSSKNRHL